MHTRLYTKHDSGARSHDYSSKADTVRGNTKLRGTAECQLEQYSYCSVVAIHQQQTSEKHSTVHFWQELACMEAFYTWSC